MIRRRAADAPDAAAADAAASTSCGSEATAAEADPAPVGDELQDEEDEPAS